MTSKKFKVYYCYFGCIKSKYVIYILHLGCVLICSTVKALVVHIHHFDGCVAPAPSKFKVVVDHRFICAVISISWYIGYSV